MKKKIAFVSFLFVSLTLTALSAFAQEEATPTEPESMPAAPTTESAPAAVPADESGELVAHDIVCYNEPFHAMANPQEIVLGADERPSLVVCPEGYFADVTFVLPGVPDAPRVRLSFAAAGLYGLGWDPDSHHEGWSGQGEVSVTWLAVGGNGPGLAVGGGAGSFLDEATSFLAFRPFYFLDLEALDLELGLRYEVAAEEWAEDPDVHAFQGSVRLLGQVDWLHLFVEVDAGFEAVSRRVRTVRDSLEGDLHATSVRPADNRFSFRALAGFAIPLRF